jgi:hypothetical protein
MRFDILSKILLLPMMIVLTSCATYKASGPMKASDDAKMSWSQAVEMNLRRQEYFVGPVRSANARVMLLTPAMHSLFFREPRQFHGLFSRELGGYFELLSQAQVNPEEAPIPEEQETLFIVALYVTDQKNRDLAIRSSIWDVTLSTERTDQATPQILTPHTIETLRNSPELQSLFPFIDRFDDVYLLRFRRQFPYDGCTLRIQSALAQLILSWNKEKTNP